MHDLWHLGRAFALTRWRNRLTRSQFKKWQARSLEYWLRHDVPQVDFYDPVARLEHLPVVDKSLMMENFAAFNRDRISAADGWQAMETAGGPCDFQGLGLGASTGTSGNQALYLVSQTERLRWLGVMLAKALPRFPFEAERIAVILPQSSGLYETAAKAHRLKLSFFDLRAGLESWGAELSAFDPSCIVAPPRILRALAEADLELKPRKIFSSAETLDPLDRVVVEARYGLHLGQIYMATEGLFAVTCERGHLHLAEDAVYFEFEPVVDGLVNPVISCFQRQFQIMARYRMNDLLRLSDAPCACGSPLRVIEEIVGRCDDAFDFHGVLLTPDVLRNAVLAADRAIADFRIRRVGERTVELLLPSDHQQGLGPAHHALSKYINGRVSGVNVTARLEALNPDPARKLRRVENLWNEATS